MAGNNIGDESESSNAPQRSAQLTDEQWTEMEAMLEQGNKIAAVKAVRNWMHIDLREAKLFVDQYHASLCEIDPQRYGKISTSPGCTMKVGMLLFAMALGSAWAMWG